MTGILKDWIRTFAPRSLLYGLPSSLHKRRLDEARHCFAHAASSPEWLDPSELPAMQARHVPPARYAYDRVSAIRRAKGRAARLRWLLRRYGYDATDILEVACFDGLSSGVLADAGHRVLAIDRSDRDFDRSGATANARLDVMDAERLDIEADRFDCVFSHNAFEHFEHPDRALIEAFRVVRPGGVVYLDFGPLYFSPWGLHEYQSITVPYCHLLFRQADLEAYVARNHLGWLDFTDINGWPVDRYRGLWAGLSGRGRIRHYFERRDHRHVHLITQHASCFRSKAPTFDDLVVSNMEILIQRSA